MAKTIKATHRLRRPHGVIFDPKRHFLKGDDVPEAGARVTLSAGTHVIPSVGQLANLPDRFESLSTPEAPAEIDDPEDDGDGDPEDDEGSEDDHRAADAAVDAALEAVGGDWSALTSPQLRDLAEAYELEVQGTGSGGNVLKADWIQAVQGARGAVA
ncbi:hypothetical protein LCGC14_0251130 [marine sediment metagenome]|uniref:Uncharacterized protein n=1 Tax=marine sediment metagenome TaxID=412755 RepID=A0A0F9WPE6_9ZZZZ